MAIEIRESFCIDAPSVRLELGEAMAGVVAEEGLGAGDNRLPCKSAGE